MLLTDYQWSRNPRGMHNRGAFDFGLDVGLYTSTKMGWVKLVVAEREYLDLAQEFMSLNITPVVRVYMPRIGAAPLQRTIRQIYVDYARVGVKWFEFYNEPNLDIEWPMGTAPDWRNAQMIRDLMENWLNWAELIIALGGYPGFIPLAETVQPELAAVRWMDAFLNYMANNQYARFLNVLRGGAYCATHPYILNHFYQERPGRGPLSARAPSEQRAGEGGWHFEYPYDPLQQNNDPGRTVYGGTELTPYGDPVGLTAMGRMFNERCNTLFGTQAIPVLGTEGGIWDFPAAGQGSLQQDDRYPPYTNESQAEATVAMFDWIARTSQPWFFGVCLWKEDIYKQKGQRALLRLRETTPVIKEVPPIPVMDDGSGVELAAEPERGPGPIHGQADYHVVVMDDGLDPEWFFDTARTYWETFRPILSTRVDFFQLLPYSKSLAVTLIVREERLENAERFLVQNYPNIYLDTIVIHSEDSLLKVVRILEVRVELGRRFG